MTIIRRKSRIVIPLCVFNRCILVRYKGEWVKFDEINLYDNHLSNTFMDIALRGRQYTVQNEYLARDLSTNGCFPKAWQRSDHRFRLLKDGGEDAVNREILASSISDNIT